MANVRLVSLKCPACGGQMELAEDARSARCPFCGHTALIDSAEPKEQRTVVERTVVERTVVPQPAQPAAKKRSRKWIGFLIAAAGILLVILANRELRSRIFPQAVDPYDAVTVTFYGVSGDGHARVENGNGGELGAVRFSLDRDSNLKNGDTVTVSGKAPEGYRFDPAQKEYTVTGLTEVLGAIEQLTDAEREELHAYTAEKIDNSWRDVDSAGVPVTWERERKGLILLGAATPDARHKNLLYDVYCTTVTKTDGEQRTFWQAVCYPDVMRRGSGELMVDLTRASLESWNLGYFYGYAASSAVYGWESEAEMRSELGSSQNYTIVSEEK